MKGLVLAGGHGTRLRPLTFSGNKHMIPIANQPILFYGLKSLADAGIRDVAVILGPIQEGIRESVGDGGAFGLRIEYIVQGEPKGLAHAVLCARDYLKDEPFVMYLGDNLLQSGVRPFLARYESEHPDAVVGSTPVAHPESYGVVEVAGSRILSLEEKPSRPKSNLALIGVYLFGPAIHPIVQALSPSQRGELEITEAIWRLCQAGNHVSVLEVEGWWKDTGRPSDLLEANELVLGSLPTDRLRNQGTVAPGAVIEGRVGIGPGSVVDAGAHISGPSILGSGVRIGSGSRIGPFAAIGDGVSVARAAIRRSIVLERAQVSGVTVANSLIGRNAEIVSRREVAEELTVTVGDSSRILL